MNGYEYEQYCAEWLKKHGFHHVHVTKASNDQGIDILASKKQKRYGFQCKYYESPVGNDAVQQAFSGAAFYNCDCCGVITNQTFTKSAIALAEETDVILIDSVCVKQTSFLTIVFLVWMITLCGIGCSLLVYQSTTLHYTDETILASVFMILSSLLAMFSNKSDICLCCGCFLSFCCVLLSFFYSFQNPVFFNVLHINLFLFQFILDIKVILLLRKKNKIYEAALKEEMESSFHEDTNQKGKEIAKTLAEEIQQTITFDSYEIKNGNITYLFKTTKDISEDFALLEYTFRQYANYTNSQETYTFSQKSPKSFYLTVGKSRNQQN